MSQLNRRHFLGTSALAAGAFVAPASGAIRSSLDSVNLGYISCGGRANQLMGQFGGLDGVNVTALCDPDSSRVGKAQQRYPKAKGFSDLRKLLESKDVDAVVISTCNHWHCLAAIWAMEAGKDVYVEKPFVAFAVGRTPNRCSFSKAWQSLSARNATTIRPDAG